MRTKVAVDDALYSYMHTTRLEIRVHRLSGFHHQLIGRSFVPLCEVLENFATTAGVLQLSDCGVSSAGSLLPGTW